MGLLRTLLWFGLFLVSTFAFTVLFEYGTTNYFVNTQREWGSLVQYFQTKVSPSSEPAKPAKTP